MVIHRRLLVECEELSRVKGGGTVGFGIARDGCRGLEKCVFRPNAVDEELEGRMSAGLVNKSDATVSSVGIESGGKKAQTSGECSKCRDWRWTDSCVKFGMCACKTR